MNILIIENEKEIATYLKQGFEVENFICDIAHNGESGLVSIKKNSYDIVILGLLLDDIDGIKICKTIRELGYSVPIIILTSKSSMEDKIIGLNCGADDYVTKPFCLEELIARVKSLIRRTTHIYDSHIKISSLIVDVTTRKVTRFNDTIKLTNSEYKILELLMRNRGSIVKNSDIAQLLWQNIGKDKHNIINVYIHNLRDKIDDKYDEKLIKTIHHKGHKIE